MMDPNATLAEMLELAEQIESEHGEWLTQISAAIRLAELGQALDQWLTRGGALPNRWEDAKPTAPPKSASEARARFIAEYAQSRGWPKDSRELSQAQLYEATTQPGYSSAGEGLPAFADDEFEEDDDSPPNSTQPVDSQEP
jgi:hypothetical protein